MKPRMQLIFRSATVASAGLSIQARAQTSVKADNTTSLNLIGSWSSGGIPTSASTV